MTTLHPDWIRDPELGDGFVQTTLRFPPDYDGEVTATLVRNEPLLSGAQVAVLYLHGFMDYFFQKHAAQAFNRAGYNFYGLDLRKYGRSLGGAPHPNFCKAFEEYFPEITSAIDVITDVERHSAVVLKGHSTGALPAALYAKTGERSDRVTKLMFNSPFLEFPQGRAAARLGAIVGGLFPFQRRENPVNPWYAKSLHIKSADCSDCKGEWRFNTSWKPIEGAEAFYGWARSGVAGRERSAAWCGHGIFAHNLVKITALCERIK